jgi:hypothetical protein
MKRVLLIYLSISVCSIAFAQKDTIKIAAVGDIMLGTSYPDSSFLPKFNVQRLFRPLKPYFDDADIRFGNLEGTLTDDLSQVKECMTDGRCYFFAMPGSFAKELKQSGFNLLSIANNHQNDFGYIGRKSTRKNLSRWGINFAGHIETPTDTFTIDGIKYGFCAFSHNAGTVSLKNLHRAERIIRHLDTLCNVVIVSFHAGAEGVDAQNVTRKKEYYIGEDRGNVYEFTHRMIDAGADVLLGHGPHVTRAVEIYKNRFIAYSMGNFCTYSQVSVAGLCGVAPLFHIYTNRKGEFLKAQIVPTHQKKHQAPKYDNSGKVIDIIQQLTRVDFPELESTINISDTGWIKKTEVELPQEANASDKKELKEL